MTYKPVESRTDLWNSGIAPQVDDKALILNVSGEDRHSWKLLLRRRIDLCTSRCRLHAAGAR